jgi:hypothetical protein
MLAHLRCCIILDKGIGKEPSIEVLDRHLQRERLIRLQALIEVWWKDKLARRLPVLGSDTAHLLHTLVKEG